MNTLVVHTGGIGDFILSCPTLGHLNKTGPVDLLGYPDRLHLATATGLARQAWHLDIVDFSSVFSRPSRRLKEFLQPYDQAIVWMRDEDGVIASNLQQCGIASVRCFPGLPPGDWKGHASAYYLDCLGFPACTAIDLHFPDAEKSSTVYIHPGSGSKQKNWPRERFAVLTERLLRDGYHVAWLAGPAEETLLAPDGVPLERFESLVSLGSCLAGARGYIGNDSGITHLAAAAGCPTLAIFGPTDPTCWGPLAPNAVFVHGSRWLDTLGVYQAVQSLFTRIAASAKSSR